MAIVTFKGKIGTVKTTTGVIKITIERSPAKSFWQLKGSNGMVMKSSPTKEALEEFAQEFYGKF